MVEGEDSSILDSTKVCGSSEVKVVSNHQDTTKEDQNGGQDRDLH